MLSFFRDGFYKDLVILLLVTVVIGAVFAQGVAWAIDLYFGDTLDGMIGEYGEYDLVIHIREEAKEAALRELERIGDESFPGYRLNQSFTIAGQANFFFGLPDEHRTKEVLESIPSYFGAVPGLNGYSLMVEPSVLIRGVHSGVRSELMEQVENVQGVKFVVRDGTNLIAVLTRDDAIATATAGIEQILGQYQILELRFPMGFEVDTQELGERALAVLRTQVGGTFTNVTSAEYGEDLDAFLTALVEMRDFLKSYASQVKVNAAPGVHLAVGELIVIEAGGAEFPEPVVIEVTGVADGIGEGMIVQGSPVHTTDKLVSSGYRSLSEGRLGDYVGEVEIENERYRLAYAIEESLRLLEELEELSVQASETVDNADAVLIAFQEALMQLEVLQVQLRQLSAGIMEDERKSSGEQFLLNLLLSGLVQTLTQAVAVDGGDGSLDSLENLDIATMRESLNGISEQIGNVQEIDVAAIIEQIGFVRDTLPNLSDEEIGQSIRLINTYLGGQVIPGERIQILVEGETVDEKVLERVFRTELENPYLHTYSTSVGVINPNPRGEIFRILKEVRSIVAGLLSIVFAAVVLVLDHATVFSTLKYLRACEKPVGSRLRRFFDPIYLLGGGVGSLILIAVYCLSRSQIPYVGLGSIAFFGLILGILITIFAERFSPVNTMELMAAQSLGLSNVQIMREVVIPPSRPGLLNLLNRWKQQF